jgi:asparagine synthetase B (glutamine-hydrolysing)
LHLKTGMCGICFLIDGEGVINLVSMEENISRRGPDSFQCLNIVCEEKKLLFAGGVLHIQGSTGVTPQPYIDGEGNVLLWNGEVFDSADGTLRSNQNICDTIIISNMLKGAVDSEIGDAVSNALANVYGPFAFVYYHADSQRIYYGRDPFGRRSLMRWVSKDDTHNSKTFFLSSNMLDFDQTMESFRMEEVPISGIFMMDISTQQHQEVAYPEMRIRLPRMGKLTDANFASEEAAQEAETQAAETFQSLLKAGIQRRVDSLGKQWIPDSGVRIGVLFSGGVDSVLLAALLHHCLSNPSEPVDLINVTFFGDTNSSGVTDCTPSPDRLAAISALVELQELFPSRPWSLLHVDVPAEERLLAESRICKMIAPSDTHMDLNIGTAFWFASRAVGYVKTYNIEDKNNALQQSTGGRPLLRLGGEGAALGVGLKVGENIKEKFSGACTSPGCRRVAKPGCTFRFCARCCYKKRPSLDSDELVPCAVHRKVKPNPNGPSVEEEQTSPPPPVLEPEVEVNPKSSNVFLVEKKYPLEDLPTIVKSKARVLLVGIGADEQMAGYGRHRTTYMRGGVNALAEELDVDLERLHSRNLGRDDRCISDHGKEAWFPYLDERVVTHLHSLSLPEIANLREPAGQGDKKILRSAARMVGLSSCTELVKRAVQFGTRIAKHTNIREFGSNRKGSGESKLREIE